MTIKILCDNCSADLTYSMGGYDHCLCLKDREYGPQGNAVIDYYMRPLLEDEKIFCGFGCLRNWMNKEEK